MNTEMTAEDFEKMTVEEAIDYCYKHKEDYIDLFDKSSEGKRQFDCLIAILEYKTITPSLLPDYGMNF